MRVDTNRSRFSLSWLLLGLLFLPLHSSAQSPRPNFAVSVRDLSIPPKVLRAFQQGVDLLEKKDTTESLAHFQRAISEYAGYYEAYYNMGLAELKLWRTSDAEQAFRKSIELSHGRYAQPLLALGALLGYREKFDEAEEVSRKGLELDSTIWSGHYSLGWALFNLNRLEEAETSVREVLRLKPDSAEAYLLLADIHHRQHDYPAVIKDLDEYLRLQPESLVNGNVRSLRDEAEQAIAGSLSAASRVPPLR
jgi:tetratricopeptide (TPR) repeat protein